MRPSRQPVAARRRQAGGNRLPAYRPQKALLVAEPPPGHEWLHELKLDGFRMGVIVRGRTVHIVSRRGSDHTKGYPEIAAAARDLAVRRALIDGEVVILDRHGLSRFQLLQQLATSRRGLAYYAFDLLELDGEDLTPLPLEERKRRLREVIGRRRGVLRYTAHIAGNGQAAFAKACALGAEGIISKRRDRPYLPDIRSSDWQKIKCLKRQEFVVGGFTEPKGTRVGVGALLIGYYDGGQLRFAGKVGTGRGWSADFGRTLRKRLDRLRTQNPPFEPPPRGAAARLAHWVRPRLVAEIDFTEWTGDGKIRHPSLQGFRTDKKPTEVVREREVRWRSP